MTAPKSMQRRRRATGADAIPRDVLAWFRGEPRPPRTASFPWRAVSYPGTALLGDWWRAYVEANPGATPPPGFERRCLAPDPPPGSHARMLLDAARKKKLAV